MPPLDTVGAWLVGAVATGGLGKYLVDLTIARWKGKKEGAEGAAILVSSASEYARQLQEDAHAARLETATLRREFEAYRRDQQRLFRRHELWDGRVWQKLLELGEEIDAPPPLYSDA